MNHKAKLREAIMQIESALATIEIETAYILAALAKLQKIHNKMED